MFPSQLSPIEHQKLVRLVGMRCEVECMLSALQTLALWDTGAMVSAVSSDWLKKHFPELEIRSIEELVEEQVNITAANQKAMECLGWV